VRWFAANRRLRRLAVLGGLVLSGCQTFSPDGGMGVVAGIARRDLRKDVVALRGVEAAESARADVARLLSRPLTADSAVQIALLNNRGLQAAYNDLGMAEVARIEASRPPNPTASLQRISGSVEVEVEKRIVGDILALATLPARSAIAADRFREAQLRAAEATLRLAARTRRSFYRAVAAADLSVFLARSKEAAETASKLAHRLGETGAMNKLDQARQQVFYAEVTAQLAKARQMAASEREQLTRLLGLWGDDVRFTLPRALPALPRKPRAMPAVEVEAVARRVDLQAARLELDAVAKAYDLTGATRFVSLLDLSGVAKDIKDKATGERIRDRGFDVEFQIPIFDLGESRVRQATERYLQALNRLTEKAVNVRSEAREAYGRYRAGYDIAAHYRREVLPLRKVISDETLLRYNAMQIDVFDLLAEARQRIAATTAAIEAERDFWLASVDLETAVTGGGVSVPSTEASNADAAADGQ
jgi:outer membrane protein TolC